MKMGLFPRDIPPVGLRIEMIGVRSPVSLVPLVSPLQSLWRQYVFPRKFRNALQVIDEFHSRACEVVALGVHLELWITDQRSFDLSPYEDGPRGEPAAYGALGKIFSYPGRSSATDEVQPGVLNFRSAFSFGAPLPRNISSIPEIVQDVNHFSIPWIKESSEFTGDDRESRHLLRNLWNQYLCVTECISNGLPRGAFGSEVNPFDGTQKIHTHIGGGRFLYHAGWSDKNNEEIGLPSKVTHVVKDLAP